MRRFRDPEIFSKVRAVLQVSSLSVAMRALFLRATGCHKVNCWKLTQRELLLQLYIPALGSSWILPSEFLTSRHIHYDRLDQDDSVLCIAVVFSYVMKPAHSCSFVRDTLAPDSRRYISNRPQSCLLLLLGCAAGKIDSFLEQLKI